MFPSLRLPTAPLGTVLGLALLAGAALVATPSPAAAIELPAPLRINSGGGATVDAAGHAWVADRFVRGGQVRTARRPVVSNTAGVDRTFRVGNMHYAIPVTTTGTYRVRLHVTETVWTQRGKRLFDVTAEGQKVVSRLDPIRGTGRYRTQLVTVPVTVRDGVLDLSLTAVRDKAVLGGLEVLPPPLREERKPVKNAPRTAPTASPTASPTVSPTASPTVSPAASPTVSPAASPTASPLASPTGGATDVVAPGTATSTAPTASAPATTPVPAAPAAVPGPPSSSARGDLPERTPLRTYALTGMQVGPEGDPVVNGDRLRHVLWSAKPGDEIQVAPGRYRLAGIVDFKVADITLKGMGATREDVWFEHTTEMRATFRVYAGGVRLQNFTHRVYATARSSLGEGGEGNIWVMGGHRGFQMQDVLAWGSRDAAVFFYGVHDFTLNRVESRDSMSDCYHLTGGSSYGTFFDGKSTRCGDDGIGIVGYDAEGPGTPHHMTIVRHHVAGQSWGRGIGLVHTNNITFHGPTLIEDSAAAAVMLAREPWYGAGNVRTVRFLGELRIRRANRLASADHGAIVFYNADSKGVIEDVQFTGPIVVADTRSGVSGQVRGLGPGPVSAEVRGAKFYGTGPGALLTSNLTAPSTVSTVGWSASSGYSGAEPAFPLT